MFIANYTVVDTINPQNTIEHVESCSGWDDALDIGKTLADNDETYILDFIIHTNTQKVIRSEEEFKEWCKE